ncbi:MAG: HAMP domain-containing sensor histidine kinase, partial [Bacteroidetes bacterium]|nr:HAMP domain-containing sensor histidine kinase [Bacteroidota bacterium]
EKDKFFSIIAHDLRSPFQGFLGLTEIMNEELPSMSLDQIQEMNMMMKESASNLYRLLENLLEWAQMQRGTITFKPVSLFLKPKTSENLATVRDIAVKKGIEVICNIPEEFMVYADEFMLGGILRNIASNALKFTPKGGKVTISTKAILGNFIEISIRDTGIGMNKIMMENLFRLDVKSNRLGTEGEPSSGLGLILCKEFVEKQGGKIWVESEEGKGTTFYFTLPSRMDTTPMQENNKLKYPD